MDRFNKLYKAQVEWAAEQFGTSFGPEPPLIHLHEESQEILESPYDPLEYADIMLLLMDAWHRTGGTVDELLDAVNKKIQINKSRNWFESPDEPGVFYHTKE